MNTEYRMNAKNDFDKDLFKLMNSAVFGKIKLVTNDTKRNKLVSEPNHHTTKWFSENLLAIEMKKKNSNKSKQANIFRISNIVIK